MKSGTITLVGENEAKLGNEFIFIKPLESAPCKECKLRNICFSLESQKRYRIVGLRSKHHECEIHEGGVNVVEVEKCEIIGVVEERCAFEGAAILVNPNDCNLRECENFKICHPPGIGQKEKMIIKKVVKRIECPKMRRLKEVVMIYGKK